MSDLWINLLGMTIGAMVVGSTYWWTRRNQPSLHRRVLARPPQPGTEMIGIECLDCRATGRGVPIMRDGVPADYRHEWEPAAKGKRGR